MPPEHRLNLLQATWHAVWSHDKNSWPAVFSTWLLVGLSNMSPLQVVQMIASLCAIVLTLRQLYLSFKTGQARRKLERESRRMAFDSAPHHHGDAQ